MKSIIHPSIRIIPDIRSDKIDSSPKGQRAPPNIVS
jgi:hypothetical protein